MAWKQLLGRAHVVRRLSVLSGVLLIFLVSAGCDLKQAIVTSIDLKKFDASQTITKEIPYSGQRIVVDNSIGVVSIAGLESDFVAVRPFVSIEAVKKVRGVDLSKLNVIIEQTAKEIRIRTEASDAVHQQIKGFPPRIEGQVGWVEYTLRIPPNATLMIQQDAGVVQVTRLRGSLTVSNKAGEILVSDSTFVTLALEVIAGDMKVTRTVAKDLSMSTQLGDLHLEDAAFASAVLSSQAGDVSVSRVGTQAEADNGKVELAISTRTGGISISKVRLKSMHVETQAGSIKLADVRAQEGQISTLFGSISLELGLAESAQIVAQTQFGGIKLRGSDRRVKTQWSGFWPGKKLTMTLSGGQNQLVLNTQIGSIRISFSK
ncbi:DUF4097 family beta strand repeat protein [Candidatus Acetothermia bacterium]|nr:DUF4097 family beta strand repeat protein [Candidatus Acetothermia bacterium]MBI3461196.1 DUF4097 family beta strand repeat protein [Candidatus Acetothermia bacterium]MBI3660615.1 DUF4097 family beta strand repeat protein [Candidatus Acetothermia bacterium]